jgi:protease IV
MAQFFKFFFAAFLAFVVFIVVMIFLLVGIAGSIASKNEVVLDAHSVLYLDLGKTIPEQSKENLLAPFGGEEESGTPGLFDLVQMIHFAKSDDKVDGIYLKCGSNANGFATNEEIRNALADFKSSGKFILAFGEVIPQQAYHVADVANKVYVHPKGGLDWKGFGVQYVFFKQALDRLNIQPQIFYAGKFKSATEPFREDKMTTANQLQSSILLNDLYQHFLYNAATARQRDTAQLRKLADTHQINSAGDALQAGLVDGLKYEDEIKEEIRRKTGATNIDNIKFVGMAKYAEAVNFKNSAGSDRVAIIYAQGDIVDGVGDENQVGG